MKLCVGDTLPSVTVREFPHTAEGGALGPVTFDAAEQLRGKHILIFGLPGAFTPTCSGQHLPGYLALYDAFKDLGIDEIWCLSVNDAFVMHAWGKDQGSLDKIRMIADGCAAFAQATGLAIDLRQVGMGTRIQRFAMRVVDGAVASLDIETESGLSVSSAEHQLQQLKYA